MKLAILGTGFIVREGALPALREVSEIEVTAILSRPRSKSVAEALAKKFSVPKIYTDFDELLANDDAEFVYVGVINSVHYEYAKRALLAGKNVIMEKPFASTAAQTRELCALAVEKNLYVFEAVTLLHCPNFHAIKKFLPELGTIRAVTANYSQYSSRYDKYLRGEVLPAFDPKLSGGALFDINIYNLNFIIGLFGAPREIFYSANIGFNGVDTSGVVLMKYPNFFATATGAKDSDSPGFVSVQGERGWLKVLGAPNELKAFEVSLRGTGATTHYELNRYPHRMVHEFKEFARIYGEKNFDEMKSGLEISLAVMETAERARKSAGIIFGDE